MCPTTRANATLSPAAARPGVVLFGIRCRFTFGVLRQLLLASGRIDVRAVLLPGPPGVSHPLPVRLRTDDAVLAAYTGASYALPAPSSAATATLLHRLQPDVIVVACYPFKLPQQLVGTARCGAFNVHPSLLPALRGPDPLFWTFRAGDGEAGVTLHQLTERFDAGPIYRQARLPYADGTPEAELETQLAQLGGQLSVELIEALHAGPVATSTQDDAKATYAPWPEAADFVLRPVGSARAAFNFVRGVRERGTPVFLELDGEHLRIDEALAWRTEMPSEKLASADGISVVQFDEGVLVARVTRIAAERSHRG